MQNQNNNEEWREKVLDIIQISATPERATDRILDLISQAEQRGYQLGWIDRENNHTPNEQTMPMGASQWLEYGKKYGYADYFEKQAEQQGKREGLGKVRECLISAIRNGKALKNCDVYQQIKEILNQPNQ